MKHYKILFVYPKDENPEEYGVEGLWASKKGDYFKIDNIPFYVKNIAFGDVIKAEVDEDDNAIYFEELIYPSGNSVVRIIPTDKLDTNKIGRELENLGCDWEGLKSDNLMAVNVPKNISYQKIKKYLEKGRSEGLFDYEEACLGFK